MSFKIKQLSKSLALLFCSLFALSAQSALIMDGSFEASSANTPWSFTPTATLTTNSPISGNQSLLLSNANIGNNGYVVGFQTVALDGANFVVGDEIFLSGLAQLVSSQAPFGRIFMEIAFRNGGTDDVLGVINDVDFSNSVFIELVFGGTGSELFSTPSIVIPDVITSLDGTMAATTGIRIALSIGPVDTNNSLTEVLFDDVRLQKVPEPSMLALLGLACLFLRARSKKA